MSTACESTSVKVNPRNRLLFIVSLLAIYVFWPYYGAYLSTHDSSVFPILATLHLSSLIPLGLLFFAWLFADYTVLARSLAIFACIALPGYFAWLFVSNGELLLRAIIGD